MYRTYRPEGCALPSSALLHGDFTVRQQNQFGCGGVCSGMWLPRRRVCFVGLCVAGLQQQELGDDGSSDLFSPALWTSPTKRRCGVQPRAAAAFCRVALAEASGRYFCTGGCRERSLWEPSLLQRESCENDLFFHSTEFSRRAQPLSNTAPRAQRHDPPRSASLVRYKKTRVWGTSYRAGKSVFLRELFLN